jgi:hypothetical protein
VSTGRLDNSWDTGTISDTLSYLYDTLPMKTFIFGCLVEPSIVIQCIPHWLHY